MVAKIYRCGKCRRLIKVGNERFYQGIAYGSGCYKVVTRQAVDIELRNRRE